MSEVPKSRRHLDRSDRNPLVQTSPVGVPAAGISDQEISYGDLFRLLWRRKWSFAFVVALSMGVCFVYLRRATPLYQSSARLCLEPGSRGILGEGDVTAQPANYLTIQSELLRSPAILSEALARSSPSQLVALKSCAKPLTALRNGLKVDVDKSDDSIGVGYSSPSPEEAALVVNNVVDSYVEYQTQKARSAAAEVVRILQKEKDSWDAKREKQSRLMVEFRRDNPTLSYDVKGGNIILQKLDMLSTALTMAQMESMSSRALEEAASRHAESSDRLMALIESGPNGKAIDSPAVAAVEHDIAETRQKLVAAQAKLANLEAHYLPNHPQIAATKALVADLTAELPGLEKRKLDSLREMIHLRAEAAPQKEKELQAAFDLQQREALGLNQKAAEYARLERDLGRIEKLSDLLDARIKGIDVSRDLNGFKVSILEAATPADSTSEPQKTKVMGIALAIGLLLGFACVLTLDWADQRLWGAKEIRGYLRLPVIGVVPHIRGHRKITSIGRIVEVEPMSPFSEACRALRTAVFFGLPGDRAKRLLITSAVPGEGKSVTAANLAISMGQAGSRTLLVDADLRNASQHEIFSIGNNNGLTSVLAGKLELGDVIQASSVPGLDILTAGPSTPNPSELLNSQRFEDVLNELAGQYDQIVFDSPPVKLVTDPCVLAVLCDATVLVFRAARSMRRESEETVLSLQSLGVHVLGGIVNDMPSSATRYTYDYPAPSSKRRKRMAEPPIPTPAGETAIVVARRRR